MKLNLNKKAFPIDSTTVHQTEELKAVIVENIPSWLITVLKKPEIDQKNFEKQFVKHAESVGLLPVTVWWYPSSWTTKRHAYWKYLVKHKKFSQLELLIEERLDRYQNTSATTSDKVSDKISDKKLKS